MQDWPLLSWSMRAGMYLWPADFRVLTSLAPSNSTSSLSFYRLPISPFPIWPSLYHTTASQGPQGPPGCCDGATVHDSREKSMAEGKRSLGEVRMKGPWVQGFIQYLLIPEGFGERRARWKVTGDLISGSSVTLGKSSLISHCPSVSFCSFGWASLCLSSCLSTTSVFCYLSFFLALSITPCPPPPYMSFPIPS